MIDRLVEGARADGSWGYQPGAAASAEPTAMVALALAAHGKEGRLLSKSLEWLVTLQRGDGAVPVLPALASPCWPTALALLAWLRAGGGHSGPFAAQTKLATSWLVNAHGVPVHTGAAYFGHDTALIGWPWVRETHSWVEPTAYAVLGLCAAGARAHSRVRQGVRLLLDRALPNGGWNYGNTRVFDNVLRPFPAPSGAALAALAGEPADQRIDRSIEYVEHELRRVRSPFSLGWGLIGLAAWGARPQTSDRWLAESAARTFERFPLGPNHLYDAVLLLADARDWLATLGRPRAGAWGSDRLVRFG
ncbi:MAG: hypothetical protein V3W34_01600 [Phycisphaerae bacterium]